MHPHRPYYQQQPVDMIPPPIQVAIVYLRDLSSKTQPIPGGEVGSEGVDGQELCIEEQQTRVKALSLLNRWFDCNCQQTQRIVDCPQCHNGPFKIHCQACGGHGKVMFSQE